MTQAKHFSIAFIPDAEATARAIAVSRTFREYASDPDFVLGTKRNIPHLSLFHLMLDEEGVQACADRLRQISDELGPLSAGAFPAPLMEIVGRGGALFWEAQRTPDIMAWHERVLELCEPLRKGKVSCPYRPKGKRAEAWQRDGYVFARGTYKPRMTLQRLKDRRERSYSKERKPYHWRPDALVLTEVNQRGVIVRPDYTTHISL